MSEANTKVLEDTVADLKKQLASALDENKKLAESHTKAAIDSLESEKKDLSDKLAAASKSVADLTGEIETLKKSQADVAAKLAETEKAKSDLEAEVSKTKADALKASRISVLVEGGVDKDSATATVEQFAALDDAQFKAISDLAIKAAKAKCEDEEMMKKDKEKAKKTKAEADLEGAELDKGQAALEGTGAEEEADKGEELRKSLASFFESFGIGTTEQGE